jgi:hypothetical protein
MQSLVGILGAGAVAKGIGQSLGLARAANPRSTPLAPSRFQGELDLAARNLAASSSVAAESGIRPSTFANAALGDATSLEELRAQYKSAAAEFEQRLRNSLRERGIDVGDEVALEADALGQIKVAGNHPQTQAIESLFRETPDLRNLFMQLDAHASSLRAADIAAEVEQLYAAAPLEAADRIQQLLGAKAAKFSLVLRPHEITTRFA